MNTSTEITQGLVERLGDALNLLVFTGSGVSAESGIPTFRGNGGLWEGFRSEELATSAAFEADPEKVWRWYDYRRQLIAEVEPNPAHRAIAALEKAFKGFQLITQNIDGLHQKAGSRNPVELHGNIWRARCVKEQAVVALTECPLKTMPPKCRRCGAYLRPDVVWFGEPLPPHAFELAHDSATRCDAMLVVGTSAQVMPAASLPLIAKHNGALVVEVNTGYTAISALIDVTLLGAAGEVLPGLAERVIKHVESRRVARKGASRS
jgi:NAD-dependent deacetylase